MPKPSSTLEKNERMTLTVAQYSKLVGVGESVVRQEVAANRLPHRKFGKRGLIRILRAPALAELTQAPTVTAQTQDKEIAPES